MKRYKHGGYVGGAENPEHYIWRAMLKRCASAQSKDYKNYGGRGIKVCSRWQSYKNFLADMGKRPWSGAELDRKDNDGDYEPSNCRWVTHSTQEKNKRTTRRWSYGRKTLTLVEWAAELGISKSLAYWRLTHWGTFQKGGTWLLQKVP